MINIDEDVLEQDEELIEFWRETLPKGQVLYLPRIIIGKAPEYMFNLSQDELLCDPVSLTREHLDNMSNQEVQEYIYSQAHTIQ